MAATMTKNRDAPTRLDRNDQHFEFSMLTDAARLKAIQSSP